MPPQKPHWDHLYREVVTSGLCTGCAGCTIACPHDMLRYDDTGGRYRPWKVNEDGGPSDCTHGVKGCTICTRACPRFRDWEPEVDQFLFGRARTDQEVAGVYDEIVLARATDLEVLAAGQDGGIVSAILIWALEHDVVDAALVSELVRDDNSQKAVPALARNRAEVLARAGSRYIYSANSLAYRDAVEEGAERIALVGTSCQASLRAVMSARKAGKVARRLVLSIGLLCSKTFDDEIFEDLFEARYCLRQEEIAKINIKGVFQIWTRDGSYHEVPLKEGHGWTREGCKACPDFSAQHADISAGGIGFFGDWTLTVIRTEQGRLVISQMLEDEAIETHPGGDDPGAIELMKKLARSSRRRWPANAAREPGLLPSSA
jgi:coenzyme F420 hydrogenase subunit beta